MPGGPFESSDGVFGVKESLVVDLKRIGDVAGLAEKHGVSPDTKLLEHHFVLITEEESRVFRDSEAQEQASRHKGRSG